MAERGFAAEPEDSGPDRPAEAAVEEHRLGIQDVLTGIAGVDRRDRSRNRRHWKVAGAAIGVVFAAILSLIGLVLNNQDNIQANQEAVKHNTELIHTHDDLDLHFQCVFLQAHIEEVADDPPSAQKDHSLGLLVSLFKTTCPQP